MGAVGFSFVAFLAIIHVPKSDESSIAAPSSAINTAVTIGIIVGVIILIAIIVGIILCVVCCVKAASPSPSTRGVVMTNPGVAVVSTQGAANRIYVPPQPQPQVAYPSSQAAYPPPQVVYPPSQAVYLVPPPSKDASAPPSYESLTTEAKL